jgi:hypothetical protein
MESVIVDLLLEKESFMDWANSPYKARRNFFELIRFDFMLDSKV